VIGTAEGDQDQGPEKEDGQDHNSGKGNIFEFLLLNLV